MIVNWCGRWNANGNESRAYTNKHQTLFIDNVTISSEGGSLGGGFTTPETYANVAPALSIQGDNERSVSVGEPRRPGFFGRPGPAEHSVRVGEPLSLLAHLADDGLPTCGAPCRPIGTTRSEEEFMRLLFAPPKKVTVGKIVALYLSWNLYRGEGQVTFDPPQTKVWEDIRAASNSPWGVLWLPPEIPADGMIEATATFDAPGTYVLWARADDGSLQTDGYITVNVTE